MRQRKNQPRIVKPASNSKTSGRDFVSSTDRGVELEKPQSVFKNLAEFANLRCSHRTLFARRREIIIEALFQVPLKQLNALLHADLFGTTTSRLMQVSNLDESPHSKAKNKFGMKKLSSPRRTDLRLLLGHAMNSAETCNKVGATNPDGFSGRKQLT
jgi:hypothetical protein